MKCALSFTNCAPANWIIGPFPALCQGTPPVRGKQGMFEQRMFGSTAGDVQEQSWDKWVPITLLGHLRGTQPLTSRDWSFRHPLSCRGKLPDLRVTVGESLVKFIKCQNAPNILQQQSAEVNRTVVCDFYLTSLCMYLVQGKKFTMWQPYYSIFWFRMYNRFLVQMGLKQDSRSQKKNMLTRQGRAERRADHHGRLGSFPVTSGWEGSPRRALAWCCDGAHGCAGTNRTPAVPGDPGPNTV